MSNPTPILNNINAFDATKGTIISFNIIGGTDIVRSNIVYIYDLSTNDLICTHLYISTESIHELPPNTDSSIVYADGKSSEDFVNNKNYYLQIQTFTNTAGTAGGSGMSVAKTFWCLFNPALSVNAIPAAISTTSYNVGATYTTNITDVTIPVTNIIQQYKFDLYTATGTLVQTSGNIIGSGEQEGTSTTYNITYNFSGLVVNNSYYVVVTTTSTEGMTVSAQSNTFTVSIDTPTVGGAIVNNNACDGYISVVSNLSDEYGGHVSGEMASFETDSVNNVSSLKVDMEPIQDLHGYDKPWVGGGGVNKWDEVWELGWISSSGDNRDSSDIIRSKNYVPVTPNTTYCIVVPSTTDIVYFDENKVAIGNTDKNGAGDIDAPLSRRTTHDNCYFIRFWTRNQTTYNHNIAINYPSTVTSYSPYSNICPISGKDSVSASVVGVNVWDEEWELGWWNYQTGVFTANSSFFACKSKIRVLPNTDYYWKCPTNVRELQYYDANGEPLGRRNSFAEGYMNTTFTTPANCYYLTFYFGGTYGTTYNNDISINYPSTDHDYHAYQGQSYHQDIEATYTPTVQDNTPYLFKQTGDVGGDRESIELVGGTVAWNQLIDSSDILATIKTGQTINGVTVKYDESTRMFVATGTATAFASFQLTQVNVKFETNHVYMMEQPSGASSGTYFLRSSTDAFWNFKSMTRGDGSTAAIRFVVQNGQTVNVKFALNIHDLTALFNPTIADYIYSLEQSQAGAGVAWFRNYFPKDYYPYDKGTLRSVEGVSAHETVGFNQWDGTKNDRYYWSDDGVLSAYSANSCTNKIRLLPNTTYYFKKPEGSSLASITIKFFDEDMHLISKTNIEAGSTNRTLTTPNNVKYTTVNYGEPVFPEIFCINISDPTRNGEYEPYVKHTYPLDSSLTLRGVPKLVDGKLAFDGDVYPPSGEVQRRYGVVDLGTLNWNSARSGDGLYFYAPAPNKRMVTSTGGDSNLVCAKYTNISPVGSSSALIDKSIMEMSNTSSPLVAVKDLTYSDVASFKAAMSGVYLVYELATPTTETAEPFINPQVVDSRGTEAYVTTGIVPVGHNTTYLTRDIFGGTLDLVTGVLTVDRKMVDMGTLNWALLSASRFWVMPSGMKPFTQNLMSSQYVEKTVGVGLLNNGEMTTQAGSGEVYLKDTRYTTATEFKSAVNGVQLCYELATPQTYQLTPHQIQTLVGQNNMWSDAGDVDVTFNLPITNLLVKRQDTSDISGNWLTLYSQPITQASDMDFTYIDFLNQYGKTYRYALVPLLTQQQGDIDVEIEGGYTVSDDILSVFDGVFIANNNGSQKLKAATEYGDLETNQDVGVLTTIGNKYPFVVSNSNLNYHSGSISALIVPSDFYTSGDLDRLDIVERREAMEQFLTDKTAKILKDWNGNIWLITFVENVEVSFVDDYGMGLGTLSAKWVEIGDVNDQTDLQQTGLI